MSPLARRIVAAFGAHSFGQAINIFIQLASLPLFLSKWSTATYGTWLILTAIPTYLTMSDGGLVTAAANKLCMAYARDEREEANRVFQSAFGFILISCSAIWLFVAGLIWLHVIPGTDRSETQIALLFLASSVLTAQFNGLAEAVFRAAGAHARGIVLGNVSRLTEWSGWIFGLFYFGTFEAVAGMGFAGRLLGLTLTIVLSIRLKSGIAWGLQCVSRHEIYALGKPAISFMAFPLANATGIQGITLLVGHLFGPAAVTVFNTYRTIARVALQVTGTLANSLWAEFSRIFAMGGASAVASVYHRAMKIGTIGSITMSGVLLLISPYLLSAWSRNKVSYEPILMAIMLTYAAVGGLWNVPRTLLMSINQHKKLSHMAVLAAVASLLVSYPFGKAMGLTGVAVGVLLVEAVIAFLCISLAGHILRGRQ